MLCHQLLFELGPFRFIILHFLVPEVVEIVHFFLVGFVDLVILVLVSDLHFVDSSQVELLSQLFGADSVGFGIDIVSVFLVLGHGRKYLVELGFKLLC